MLENKRVQKPREFWISIAYFRASTVHICVRKNKSKQSYVWIVSIFKAQNICFGAKIVGLLESFLW